MPGNRKSTLGLVLAIGIGVLMLSLFLALRIVLPVFAFRAQTAHTR